MLFVDDITYTPADSSEPLEVKSYCIYRNGVMADEANGIVETTAYDDPCTEAGQSYRYTVTTVYNTGESLPSNEVEIVTSSVGAIQLAGITVEVVGHKIIITGADGCQAVLASVDGRVIARVLCSATTEIDAPSGVALLRVGDCICKVIIR